MPVGSHRSRNPFAYSNAVPGRNASAFGNPAKRDANRGVSINCFMRDIETPSTGKRPSSSHSAVSHEKMSRVAQVRRNGEALRRFLDPNPWFGPPGELTNVVEHFRDDTCEEANERRQSVG